MLLLCVLMCGVAWAEGSAPTVTIGAYLPMSGGEAGFGTSVANGAQMAADEINQRGVVHVELRIADDGGDDERTSEVVHDLIERDRVSVLLGDVTSSRSRIGAEIAQAARVPMLTPSASSPALTRGRDGVFRMCWIDPVQAEAMAKFAHDRLKARTAALLVAEDSDYAASLGDTFTAAFKRMGGRIVARQTYATDAPSFAEPLKVLAASKPDVLYVAGYYPDGVRIAASALRQKLRCPLLGGDGWDATPLRESVGDLYYTTQVDLGVRGTAMAGFVRRYYARWHTEPDALSVLGYDSVCLIADAALRAGSADRARLRDALAATRGFPALSGTTTMTAGGDPRKPIVILHCGAGRCETAGAVEVP